MREIYVWRRDGFYCKRTGEPMRLPVRDGVCCPRIQGDIAEYLSPVTGLPVGSRSARREDLLRHGCIEVDPPKRRRGYRNPRFAHRRGLPVDADE
jgi:hypothetical protein